MQTWFRLPPGNWQAAGRRALRLKQLLVRHSIAITIKTPRGHSKWQHLEQLPGTLFGLTHAGNLLTVPLQRTLGFPFLVVLGGGALPFFCELSEQPFDPHEVSTASPFVAGGAPPKDVRVPLLRCSGRRGRPPEGEPLGSGHQGAEAVLE